MRKHAAAAALAALLLAAAGPCAGAERNSFAVGTAVAAEGREATGTIEVPAGVDPALHIPVALFHGAWPGPVLALVAGSPGTEYASILALEKLIGRIDPTELSGTLIVVPLINIPSFEGKIAHVNPVDGKSMNRFYPGKADGTQTERAAYAITREVVEKCDYLIDLHGGDLDENLRPYSYWARTGNEKQDAASRGMVLAFGLDHIILANDRPRDPAASRYLETTAATRGKPSITVEAGRSGRADSEDIEALANGCLSVMRYLKILPGTPSPVERPVWIEKVVTLSSDHSGIFYPRVDRGDYVESGMKIGLLTDYLGKTIAEPRATATGVILYVAALPSMKKGDTVANIGVVAARAP
ncbi:MAG TPA: M14 family metallopeptidase [Thermoanaerobaculia bacterium]|nr:M14 family metallopeptidase [Thermoanaerobaculia bacterium]